ncbi:heterokaryon incompatibility protein-domain-containing protein [Nemania sp. FL0916]|nr:heterokaryon incompatibility protein-domain-containing protein [Nemania sp. FL0916]
MDWTRGGLDEHVSFTESYPLFMKSQYDHSKPFNPKTYLPEFRSYRMHEWENQSSDATTGESTSTEPTLRHPCEVLAEHWDDVFERYPFASHLFDIGILDLKSSHCGLCKLLAQGTTTAEDEFAPSNLGVYTVNLLGERERLAADNYAPENYVMGITISVGGHSRLAKHLKGLSRRNHRHGPQGLLVPAIKQGDKQEYRSPYMARVIDPNQVEFGLLNKWIDNCRTNHTACQHLQGSIDELGVTLTVVDCVLQAKVPLARGEKYLALSYRWGPPPQCDDPWAVSAAPRTVRDAMVLTLKLGFRYLWVDRHCIDQSDDGEKAKQLGIMDYIYEQATLTIVAMAGVDDSYGLPGLGTEPVVSRTEPSQVNLAGHTLVSLSPNILTSVQQSEWSARAWTFQEALLSRRLLLFTSEQVYFVCRTTYWSELLPDFPDAKQHRDDGAVSEYDPYSGSDPEVSLSNLFYFESGGLDSAASELDQFSRDVNIYLKRTMSDEKDGLNAFRGILNRSFYWSYYGVPLITRLGRELSKTMVSRIIDHGMTSKLPTTVGDSVRIIVEKYVSSQRMEKMISVISSAAAKKRERKTIFGSTYYDDYKYDSVPGPGEPFDPSPALAFLHGLSWAVDPETTCHRRPSLPTWSWVSIYGGAITFDCDPDGVKELPTDVWTILNSDVKVWLPSGEKMPPDWIEFDAIFRNSPTKVIPELSSLIRVESYTGNIEDMIFQPRARESTYDSDKILISVVGQTKAEKYEIHVDCLNELPHCTLDEVSTWKGLQWKLILISRTSIYNPDRKWRHMWSDWEPTNVFLIIRPAGPCWKRVGLLKTKDRLYHHMKRMAVVLT